MNHPESSWPDDPRPPSAGAGDERETGRDPAGRFRAGTSGNPRGRPKGSRNASDRVWRAIEDYESTGDRDFFLELIESCSRNSKLRLALALKLLPSKSEDRVTKAQLKTWERRVCTIIARHVHDVEALEAITNELTTIDLDDEPAIDLDADEQGRC